MITVHYFTFNPFAENTYLLMDKDDNALLIDPGMYYPEENNQLFEYLQSHKLSLKGVLLTHAHLDHIFGLKWVFDQYNLKPVLNRHDEFIYKSAESTAMMYGVQMPKPPEYTLGLEAGSVLQFGGEELDVVHTPGHSPGSVSFISREHRFVIGGDVLFQGSIGRTDLPGGDYATLIQSIKSNFLNLTDDYKVYSGHGPVTTIGQERRTNPFLQD